MKYNFLIISTFFTFLNLQTKAQVLPPTTEAPLNPEFNNFHLNDDNENFGLVPEPMSIDYSNFTSSVNNASFKTSTLPSVYDMRLTNGITSVKNQGACGSCWLFPSVGALESRWQRLGLGTYDLAEDNLKHCSGFDYAPCVGGNRSMANAYFTRGKGPVLESQDPYTAASTPGCPTGLTPVANVTEAWYLPDKSINDIKQALYTYGAVYNTFFWNSKWYNSATKVYCMTQDTSAANNHAVLIVGWDDNKVTPLGTGAWIIKNSWGSAWGEGGFFYLSYQDKKGAKDPTIWVNRENYNPDNIHYGYDHLGWTGALGGSKTSYGAVKYTTTSNQRIKQIATYAVAPNCSISAEIYSNFNGTTFSGLLASIPSQTFQYSGYYTLNLPTPIILASGTDFYVRYKISNTTSKYPLAGESQVTGYTSGAIIETGKCWISTTGTTWTSIGANTNVKYDLCLKVIAESSCQVFTPTVTTGTLVNICSAGSANLAIAPAPAGVAGTYKWQVSTNNGTSWSNLSNTTKYSNVTTNQLNISNATATFDEYLYRCVFTNTCAALNSNTIKLRVTTKPVIVTQPTNKTVAIGGVTNFNVTVSNLDNCSYQWQIKSGTSTWTDLTNNNNYAGVNTSELYVDGLTSLNGKNYRCKLKTTCSTVIVYSSVVTLSVNATGQKNIDTDIDEEAGLSIFSNSPNITNLVMYPNPANNNLSFDFEMENDGLMEITIFDLVGRKIKQLENQFLIKGTHTAEYSIDDLQTGTYLVAMSSINTLGQAVTLHKKLIVVK